MRILHTADWHLGDRLGRIDRTDDLRKAVERVAEYCRTERADVLLVAGDLFSELARPDGLRDAIRHLQETFHGFLRDGGTILTLTGNHDNENFCQTLRHAMSLAAPETPFGAVAPAGRLYLAAAPTLLRLKDRDGPDVQFVLMPYPTPARYLQGEAAQRFGSHEERNRHLMAAYSAKLREIRGHERFDASLQTVLAAHVAVRGSELPTLFRLSEEDDVIFAEEDLPADFAYVALGHIHKPQCIGGRPHVRYSGSIERLDLGERQDDKGVVVFDLGRTGLAGEPRWLRLPATPVYEVEVTRPKEELDLLADRHADAAEALVYLAVRYEAGDNLEAILRKLDEVFPNWYGRHWNEAGELGPSLTTGEAGRGRGFEEVVRDYLGRELVNHTDAQRGAVLALVEELMRDVGDE